MYPLRANSITPLHIYLSHTHRGHKYTCAHTGPTDMQLLFRDVRAMGLPQSGTVSIKAPGSRAPWQGPGGELAPRQPPVHTPQ